ncbi:hypothetical protein EJ02DRAFT_484092 [Clathrospora elynae]|uniref:C2H2-type domain-containing protein n=1 Tax=Clathrospora elynae TaxID=706981 RepID=A0A6A5S4X0_9PLEO|nr:hypothetical protein EJ02DRAFT_484092 [Clathrospora elynae]
MQRRSLVKRSSSSSPKSGTFFKESDYTRPTGNDVDLNTGLTDIDAFAHEDNKDEAWLFPNEDHPPEYYLQQLQIFNKQEYTKQDYKDNSTCLLNLYERAAGVKLDAKMNRSMQKVKDLARVLQMNLVTTKKRYPHRRYRIQAQLYLQLGGFTANWPQALLGLCYWHIQVTLLRDPEGGPHRVLLEFTFEFTKEFLGIKDLNTFPLPKIMYDETLLFSLHVFLLGLLFCDRAFAASNLTSPEELSRLTIPSGRNKLPLRLNPMLDNIPVFWKAVTGFAQVTRHYLLRYAGGKAFNENGNISKSMQNLMMGHASITTFLKHYLSQPACTMSRSIDCRRPRQLTEEQYASVDNDPSVCSLLDQQEQLKRTVPCTTKHPKYRALASKLSQERQRQQHALLWDIKERWEFEQPMCDVERQLAGLETKDNPELVHNVMLPAQGELANLVLSKPGTTIEEEMDRRNGAICAVTLYCGIEEGGMNPIQIGGQSRNAAPPVKSQLEYKEEALEAAKVLVYKEKRLKVCFLCLGNKGLPLAQRIHPFGTPGNLTKHLERKHLRHIKSGDGLSCNLCKVPLEDKMHLQQHAQDIHGTDAQQDRLQSQVEFNQPLVQDEKEMESSRVQHWQILWS